MQLLFASIINFDFQTAKTTIINKMISFMLLSLLAQPAFAQNAREDISRTGLNYIEGFYEGDTTKLIISLKPSLHKFGYWKDKNSGKYAPDEYMTYRQALDYAIGVREKKHFAKPGVPKKVEVFDIQNTIAS